MDTFAKESLSLTMWSCICSRHCSPELQINVTDLVTLNFIIADFRKIQTRFYCTIL